MPSKQNTRRVRICLKTFTQYGINFGDTAIVAKDAVRMNELGYFSIKAPYLRQGDASHFNQFAFLCEPDAACYEYKSVPKTRYCLRSEKHKCLGRHEGTPYGRVCAVERKRQPVKTSLALRPYDKRRDAVVTIRLTLTETGIPIPMPAGCVWDDVPRIKVLRPTYPWRKLDLRKDDLIILLETDDIREGDYVVVQDGEDVCIGQYHRNGYGHYTVDVGRYSYPFQVNVRPVSGRIIAIWREESDAYLDLSDILRPAHDSSNVIQFRKRAKR